MPTRIGVAPGVRIISSSAPPQEVDWPAAACSRAVFFSVKVALGDVVAPPHSGLARGHEISQRAFFIGCTGRQRCALPSEP